MYSQYFCLWKSFGKPQRNSKISMKITKIKVLISRPVTKFLQSPLPPALVSTAVFQKVHDSKDLSLLLMTPVYKVKV